MSGLDNDTIGQILDIIAKDEQLQYRLWKGSYIADNIDAAFLVIMGIHIHIMQYGFACLEAGCVRMGSATNSMWKNCVSAYIAAIGFWLTGYALAFGEDNGGFVGSTYWAFKDLKDVSSWFFQYSFCATASTITSGAIAERTHIAAYFISALFMAAFYYPIIVHWVWHEDGWLNVGDGRGHHMSDFAGSGVVHLMGAASAMGAIIVVPNRHGRFRGGQGFEVHSTTLASLGCMVLCSGFIAFNAGSQLTLSEPGDGYAVAMAASNTVIAGSGALISSGIIAYIKTRSFPVMPLHCGLLTGCVAICAGCDVLTSWGSFVVGFLAGMGYYATAILVEKMKLDDPVEAVAVHGGGGLVGLLSLTFLHPEKGIFYCWDSDSGKFFAWQLCGLIVITAWSFVITFVIFFIMKVTGILYATSDHDSEITLDDAHGHEPALPDTSKLQKFAKISNSALNLRQDA